VKRRKQIATNDRQAGWDIPKTKTPRECGPHLASPIELGQSSIDGNQDVLYDLSSIGQGSEDSFDTAGLLYLSAVNDVGILPTDYWLYPSPDSGNDDSDPSGAMPAMMYGNVLLSPPLTLNPLEAASADDEGHQRHPNQREDTQRVLIRRNLLKVYHDSMEGALSCWLTERNCPYVFSTFDGRNVWSSDWSNRVVSRVCSLERATSDMLFCTTRNDRQATKALNLAIMAFAAQWAQVGERSSQRLPAHFADSAPWEKTSQENFDRSMQTSLWHQASRALLDAAGNMSFKVLFALIIFSLTQRPQDATAGHNELTSMQDILESDGPPIHLELALRQLHSHRRTLRYVTRSNEPKILRAADKDTFDLLFWLAIMFDTLSAAMYQRSFVVTDDDSGVEKDRSSDVSAKDFSNCDLDGWDDAKHSLDTPPEVEVELWGDYFLQKQSRTGDIRKACMRWPCSYDDAASALCDAAPVKVLLFRRVGQLQDLTARPSSASTATIEDAIDAALDVYNRWNQTYGLFITDCINNHEDLPARIQSWYILLAGHWHLAAFILADAIDDIDQAGLTSISCRRTRQVSGLTTRLRSQSAFAVSELGRCSRYSYDDLSFSRSKDFHFAVNKAALLTEPWTVVLVRSFGRAGEILAGQLLHDQCNEARQRLQYCIDALWLLGKKSDMALRAARVLSRSLSPG
jgi:hypothetical protein